MGKNQITLLDARILVAKMVIKSGIPGLKARRYDLYPKYAFKQVMAEAKGSSFGTQYFSFEQAWGANATLEVEFKDDHTMLGGKKHPCSKPTVSFNWGSTGRDISEARVAINLYSAIVDLGCLIDTHVSGLDIETSEVAHLRQQKEYMAKSTAKLEAERDALEIGYVLDPAKPKGVSRLLWLSLKDSTCAGTTSKGAQCKGKSKLGVWSKKLNKFIPVCRRHVDQVVALVVREEGPLAGLLPNP